MDHDQHVSLAQLMAYRADDASALNDAAAVAKHLRDCKACEWLSLQLDDFDEKFDEWTPQAHGRAYRAYLEAVGRQALAALAVEEKEESFRERLAAWRTRSLDRGMAALRVAVESAAARVVDEIDGLLSPRMTLAYDVPTRSASTTTRGGSSSGLIDVEREGSGLKVTVSGF
jgi:hypothetical protein